MEEAGIREDFLEDVVEMLNVFLHSIIYSVNIVGFHVPGSVLGLRMYYEQNRQILRDWNSSRSRR